MPTPLRVLLVEDSDDDALLLTHELQRGGYTPLAERVDTAEAMEAALDRQPWDIVISDHAMPRFSAPAALALLQQRHLDLPFIIVSGKIGEEAAVMAMKAGAHDYITKDNLARLTPAIARESREAVMRRERRRAAELAIRLNRILDNATNEIYIFDAVSLHFLQVNQRARRNLGYTEEELRHLTLLALEPELGADDFARLLASLRTGEREEQRVETVFRRRDGTTYPVEVHLYLSQVEEPPVFVALVQDITERRQHEQTLREIREAERRRIARDLHESVLRDLVTTLQTLQVAQVRARQAGLDAELRQAIVQLRRAGQVIRQAIYNLQPTQRHDTIAREQEREVAN